MSDDIDKFSLPETEVIICPIAIKKIMLHAIEFSNPNGHKFNWKEIIGLLAGKILDNKVIVTDSYAMDHGSSMDVKYRNDSYVKAAIVNSLLANKGEFFAGWYHSHPGLGFFYSATDIINHLGYQDVNPKAIGLVFDHEGIIKRNKFFEIYTLNYEESEISGYRELDYEIKGISRKKELSTLKEYYERLLFYWNINFVESAEKTVKDWLKNSLKDE